MYTSLFLSHATREHNHPTADRGGHAAECTVSEVLIRPVHERRIWISEGSTQIRF